LVYENFGAGAEPHVVGVASSANRAQELAASHAEVQQYQWSRQDWSEWDSVRRARPAVDGRGDPGEVWIVEAPLDEVRPFALEFEALVYEDDE
jgi:hypothetical protein